MKNKILAIIPARSGSKGLRDKNIKLLNGKPLIAYTIEAAIKSNIFTDVVVSTDSEKYAEISREYGAKVPFLRSEENSTDKAGSTDMILEVLEELKKIGERYDYFMLLQPTSPLRTSDDIIESYKLSIEKNANSIVGVCEPDHSPLIMNTLDKNLSMDNFLENLTANRRQDMKTYYRINGAIYLCNVDYFKEHKDFYKEKSFAYIMNKINSVDIDDIIDFKLAEILLEGA